MPPHFVKQNDVSTMNLRSNSPRSASLLFPALALSLLFPPGVSAQSAPETHAKIQLVSEEESIRPSAPFWVGILFQLEPSWHIYWQNPGDSGEPPKIEWQLPSGFHAGAIRWPQPIRLGTASVRDYGYEGQVLLMASIKPPSNLSATSSIPIAATVKYVVCREICIPGKSVVTLSLPLSAQHAVEPSEWRELFKSTRAQFPKPPPSAWKVWTKSVGDYFILSVEGAGASSEVKFFPLDRSVIENAALQTLDSDKNRLRLTLKKSEQLAKPVSTLRGVIVLDQDRAYEIAVPVKSS
jgi:thiol:disulfide interchange protein DsbD